MAETQKKAAATATATDDKPAAAPAKSDAKTAKARERERRVAAGECVVDDGTEHVGGAVNGLVCSRHAVWFDRHGNRRI